MSLELYRPAVIRAWKAANSRHSLSQWVEIVGRRLEQFQNEDDIYAPIPLNVKIAGDIHATDGNVVLFVAPTDKQWYPKLVDALERMTGRKDIEVRDYLGDCIRDMTPLQLSNAGELDVVKGRTHQLVRLGAVVAPPLDMSPDKDQRLAQWWTSIRDDIAKNVAAILKDETFKGVSGAVQKNGKVQKFLADYLRSHTPDAMSWDKFTRTYATDNVAKSIDPEENLEFVSQGLLHVIRTCLSQNETPVKDYYNTVGMQDGEGLWKTDKRAGKSRYDDAFTMYRDFIEDALYLPIVGKHMVDTMLHGWTRVSPLTKLAQDRKRKVQQRPKMTSPFHPLATYYNQVHYPKHQQLPGHVMERFTTNSSVASAKEFKGDAVESMRIYHMLCGRCPTMPRVSNLPDLVPMASRMPELEPISSQVREMPELVPISSQVREMPELVPISSQVREMPELVPISSQVREMPELVPISSQMPTLVPIDSVYGNLGEPIWQDVSDMPSLDDFM